jgi:hypothetical protein
LAWRQNPHLTRWRMAVGAFSIFNHTNIFLFFSITLFKQTKPKQKKQTNKKLKQ